MAQSRSGKLCKLGVASFLATVGAIASFGDCALAQIKPDSTLESESSVVTPKVINNYPIDQIDGGATRSTNLFHSFESFSVITGHTVYFNNTPNIQNIISRVTGGSVSNIDGLLQANGNANLFLINPNGIIFGPNASLKLGGSFLATTANSLNFADGNQFSATLPQNKPLLTISVPIGLQFGENLGNIINQSQASLDGATNSFMSPVGLEVQTGQTLALIGGDVVLDGGNLTALEGRIELGSVAGNSLVSLNSTKQGWALSYEGVHDFQNIRLSSRTSDRSESPIPSFVDASGNGGGDIQVQARFVKLTGGSGISTMTTGKQPGGNLTVTALESVELIGPGTPLSTQTYGIGAAGSITLNTRNLVLSNGVQVLASTEGEGSGGQLTVNASDSVELNSTSIDFGPNILTSATAGPGAAGNLTLNTGRLLIQNGATISSASQYHNLSGINVPATGLAGNLTVNASKSVELIGGSLSTDTVGSGDAGDLTINTGRLLLQNGAQVAVGSEGTGTAGNLSVTARSILLDNQAVFNAETLTGKGNINLASQDLVLRHGSQITTDASGTATGGNLTIKTGVLTALEDSDIRANAQESFGGRVSINAQGIFGTKFRQQDTPESDITASSALGLQFNGTVQINILGINPSQGLVNLPVQPVDVTGLIAQGCPTGIGPRGSKFVVTGHGGLPPNPREALSSEPPLADLGTPLQSQENRASAVIPSNPINSEPEQIVEATGWVTNAKGKVVLVANPPTFTPNIPWMAPTTCHT